MIAVLQEPWGSSAEGGRARPPIFTKIFAQMWAPRRLEEGRLHPVEGTPVKVCAAVVL